MTTSENKSEQNRAAGILLGLACGDALGRPVEFKSANSIASTYGRVTTMLGDGTYGKPPGTVTDDTELAVCITNKMSLIGLTDRGLYGFVGKLASMGIQAVPPTIISSQLTTSR